jgi:hypothetical protein
MDWFKKLSPTQRFVIAETARVCACVAIIVTVEMVVMKGVRNLVGADRA